MTAERTARKLAGVACCVVVTAGCSFQGVNSLALPGTVGRGDGDQRYHVEIANVGTLEPNSPVLLDDVVIGSIVRMAVHGGHADVEVSVRQGTAVPANAVATIGQTSLLGSTHLALDPPPGEQRSGRLSAGATLALDRSSSYPSTEQTLAAVSALVNSGGLGQIGDIVHNAATALSGHEPRLRDLLTRLDRLAGTFDGQRGDVMEAIRAMDRLAGTLARQHDVLSTALHTVPDAIDVLNRERPTITTALHELTGFADTATAVVNDTQADLVANLRNLEPTLCSLADVGPDLDQGLSMLSTYPLTQDFIDRAVRGDYINLFATLDLTVNRIKSGILLGTRFGRDKLTLVPAPGDPGYDAYTTDPLGAGIEARAATGLPESVQIPPARPPGTPPPPPGAGGFGC